MDYRKFGETYLLRVEKGEEILACIKLLCEKENIKLASISGIGAVDSVTVGLFETGAKEYHSTDFNGDYEITSLSGNITQMNGETYIHAHISISDSGTKVYGGHLNRAVVSATSEIIITCIDGNVSRKFSDEIGLNLLEFDDE